MTRPGNDKISQAKGQTVKVSHDCIMRGKQAALTSHDMNQSGENGRSPTICLLQKPIYVFNGYLNWKGDKSTLCKNATGEEVGQCGRFLTLGCLFCLSRVTWSCPSRWPCGRSRMCASGWRNTVPTSTRSTATPSNSMTSQVLSSQCRHSLCSLKTIYRI